VGSPWKYTGYDPEIPLDGDKSSKPVGGGVALSDGGCSFSGIRRLAQWF
jgi:hypothetical protein